MAKTHHSTLTKRERQIMDVLYRLGRANASEIQALVPGTASYSTIRTQLRVLEQKGHLRHEDDGLRYIYVPTVPRHSARRTAVRHLIETFFDGSPVNLMTTLLDSDATRLSDADLERLTKLLKTAKDASR